MSYINPLHTPVSASNRSQFSSLGGAVSGAPAPAQFLSPFRRRLPQAQYTPSSKWKNATGRLNQLHNAISFDYLGYTKQGVPMRELSTRGAHALSSMIHGANDKVLAHTGLVRITFRIIVSPPPGYFNINTWVNSIVAWLWTCRVGSVHRDCNTRPYDARAAWCRRRHELCTICWG